MKSTVGLLLLAIIALAPAGEWSAQARPLYGTERLPNAPIKAPDGRSSVFGRADGVALRAAGADRSLPHIGPPIVEGLWSPHSRYLALTSSDGGAVGTYDVPQRACCAF